MLKVYDDQDSGNICFGTEKDGQRYFIKFAGAPTERYNGNPADAIARLKALAHQGYITEIKQMQREIRITLYENAHLNPEGIPPLVAKYRRQLQFKPDKEPKFLFAPVGDIVQALTVFAKELMELVEEEGKSEK